MDNHTVHIQMFGNFLISCGETRIDGSRSYRAWPALAYIVFYHRRTVSHDELIRLVCIGDRAADAENVMRFTIHRIRKILEPIGKALGMELIITGPGYYGWNQAVPLEMDAERFEAEVRQGNGAEDRLEALGHYRTAADLYTADFLARLSQNSWVLPVASYYRELYLHAAQETAALMLENGMGRDAAEVCRRALQFEPFHEPLSRQLMRALIATRDYAGVSDAYKSLSKQLYEELGVQPDEETQTVYRDALKHMGDPAILPETIKEQLKEENPAGGAMICDYAQFRRFYQAEARSAARRGDAVHIAILTVEGKRGAPLSAAVLRNTMDQLEQHIQKSLRMGDVASSCSASQFVLMLYQANFENSAKVMERMTASFYRAHPHTSAYLQYVVLPIDPLIERRDGPPGNADAV